MEGPDPMKTRPLEDSMSLIENPTELRLQADRDGFVLFRGLVPDHLVLTLRLKILDYANSVGWLDPGDDVREGRAVPGKRIGYYQDPEWVSLQVHVQNGSEIWALGEATAIQHALKAVESRSSCLCLSTANTCRVFSPHLEMATKPHQDAYYLRMIENFWTVWVPLGDCPREFGPLALLAGSHHGGLREHSCPKGVGEGVTVPDDAVWSTTDFKCGDVVLFQPHTLHCSLPNRSGDRLRLSADFRYGFWRESSATDWRATSIGR
jgi:ectoine hydroxylase-related dioxygenase (phytanoyl-CoA dioxygenase family)